MESNIGDDLLQYTCVILVLYLPRQAVCEYTSVLTPVSTCIPNTCPYLCVYWSEALTFVCKRFIHN